MLLSDYSFDLPEELIAQYPTDKRTDSRLLHLDRNGHFQDQYFPDCLSHLSEGDVLVLNNTKVIPARLFGHKETGGKVEVLLERITSEQKIIAQMRQHATSLHSDESSWRSEID